MRLRKEDGGVGTTRSRGKGRLWRSVSSNVYETGQRRLSEDFQSFDVSIPNSGDGRDGVVGSGHWSDSPFSSCVRGKWVDMALSGVDHQEGSLEDVG